MLWSTVRPCGALCNLVSNMSTNTPLRPRSPTRHRRVAQASSPSAEVAPYPTRQGGLAPRDVDPLAGIDDRPRERIEIDHALHRDAWVDVRPGAFGDAPQRVVRPDDHRLSRGHGPSVATGGGSRPMSRTHPEPHEEHERHGADDDDTAAPGEPNRRGSMDRS